GAGALRRIPGRGQEPGAGTPEASRLRPPRRGRNARSDGMMARRGTMSDGVAGGPAPHVPVLLEEVLRFLTPEAGGIFIDGTFGAGGYTRAILASGASVIGIDRDPGAIADATELKREAGERLTLVEG